MVARLKCSQGHSWDPAARGSAPLVCPTCGRSPLTSALDLDANATLDQDSERTIDSGPPQSSQASRTPPRREDVTEALHFTPQERRPPVETAEPAQSPARQAPAASPAAKPASTPPTMPFTILRQHARGGLGLVNLARDEHIKREVALKQILPQHADNTTLQKRFLYEAQITGQLEHPSIVPVYTLGSDEIGNPYYVMRFVRGRTLDDIISEHHVSPNPIVFRELLRRFIAVCQAVAYAHSRGVIHRDLKPSNIMLGDYGETLVLDWGLAKDIKNKTDPAFFTDDPGPERSMAAQNNSIISKGGSTRTSSNNPELTMQGQIIGTPAYMAPEQAEGRTELHGPVTDIYALGGILYKVLAGQSPASPSGSMTGPGGQRRLNFVASPPPSKANKDVHPLLEQICMRAMATDPAARYPRALELAQDIQRWLDEHPLALRQSTPRTRALAFLRNNAVEVTCALLAIIVLLLYLVFAHPGH